MVFVDVLFVMQDEMNMFGRSQIAGFLMIRRVGWAVMRSTCLRLAVTVGALVYMLNWTVCRCLEWDNIGDT